MSIRKYYDFSGFCTAFLGSLDGPGIEADCGEGREKNEIRFWGKNVACANQRVRFQLIKQLARDVNILPWIGC